MSQKCFKIALLLCVISTCSYAQNNPGKKHKLFSYSFNLSDYSFIRDAKDSSFNKALNPKDRFKSGNGSYGFGISYWQGLTSHIDFSANAAGTFSNFPALFVKGDTIGQAGFTSQLDALLHIRAFREGKKVNPFLTAGVGAGYFGGQPTVYLPLGTGLQFQFGPGAIIFLQAQWKMALTPGITNDFTFYSLGIAQPIKGKQNTNEAKKSPEPKTKKVTASRALAVVDTDGDGVPDDKDRCPTEPGTLNGCPDSDGDGIADKDDQCKTIAGISRYHGCPIPDSDSDGVNDEEDDCANEKGPKENMGCPWPDTDGDGVADKDDKCPAIKGLAEYNGCPLPVADGAEVIAASKDAITYAVNFEFSQSTLLPQTFAVLKNSVNILKADNSLKVFISGHADNTGTDAANMRVSAERTKIAVDYFRSYGIAPSRIKFASYGSSRPIDPEQQWRNRRVEITITRQ